MPLEQFRNREKSALMNAGIEDRQDIGVRERSDGLRLPLEASTPIWVGRDRVGQDFNRHIAAEPRVARPVDLAHTPGAESGDYLVRAKACAGGEGQTPLIIRAGWSAQWFTPHQTSLQKAIARVFRGEKEPAQLTASATTIFNIRDRSA
jgi:hypothetical protein